MEQPEIYDLLIVVDATSSMSEYLTSLQTSLPQVISISALTACFSRIGLLGYRDYCDTDLLEWSGWLEQSSGVESKQPDLVAKAKSMEPLGGGDFPEAAKTALAKACEVMRSDATTLILFYTDAPPHVPLFHGSTVTGSLWKAAEPWGNFDLEKKALSDPQSYGGFGPKFVDWVSACKTLRNGEKKAQVCCMLQPGMTWQNAGYYNYLCTMTGGSCILLDDSRPGTISKVTIDVLLAWMGVEKARAVETSKEETLPAKLFRYINIENIKKIQEEDDKLASPFFAITSTGVTASKLISANITSASITPEVLKRYIAKKKTPVSDFAKSFTTDPAYRIIVVEHLTKIINSDVRAIALNPIFGSLWRAVCNDRTLDSREGLVSTFGNRIEQIPDPDEKAQMKAWLEGSYDYTAEVKDIICSVPESERFPCVFLDPTLSFVRPSEDTEDGDEDNRQVTAFTRDELLEIGRSCDYKILRRLGRILTRLTYVKSSTDMPDYIAGTTDDDVPKVPTALASNEHRNQFWRILLHIILPGTMLSARPAALLAALSLRVGLEPLTQAAEREMIRWRNKWNDTSVPETWNVSCLSLLLDADQAYRQRHSVPDTSQEGKISHQKSIGLLREHDRNLFEQLASFKMLERNLESTLTAQIGWTPEKTTISIGPLAMCRSCEYPRSVTVMGRSGKCGHCLYTDYKSPEVRNKCIEIRASKTDKESTPAVWVECSVRTCRAQYVVYNLEDLNVRPKCYYCRAQTILPVSERNGNPAPWIECTTCLNRMIWPEAYRPSSFSKDSFLCPSCHAGRQSIVDFETTARKISAENTMSWLIQDSRKSNDDLFTNRTLFHTISQVGSDAFLHDISLFPQVKHPLTIKGKLIRNSTTIVSTLQDLISRRQIERATCSLCFSTFRPDALNPACGRRGCTQRVCRNCLAGWYGLNELGHIINTAALSCMFCRRKPAGRTLAKYGLGIHAVGNLTMAVQEQGQWIYAWCRSCGFAKQYMERVCAQGMPAEVRDWQCEACIEAAEQRRIEAERERLEAALRDARMARDMDAMERLRERLSQGQDLIQLKRVKPCPGCGTLTEKISGCDHITCPVPNCHVHWCFFCGEGPFKKGVYNHMSAMHGGYYGGLQELDDDDEDDY